MADNRFVLTLRKERDGKVCEILGPDPKYKLARRWLQPEVHGNDYTFRVGDGVYEVRQYGKVEHYAIVVNGLAELYTEDLGRHLADGHFTFVEFAEQHGVDVHYMVDEKPRKAQDVDLSGWNGNVEEL